MAWECKECGEEIVVILTRSYSNTHKIKKNGTEQKTPFLKDKSGETLGMNYTCTGCSEYFDNGIDLDDIATWR